MITFSSTFLACFLLDLGFGARIADVAAIVAATGALLLLALRGVRGGAGAESLRTTKAPDSLVPGTADAPNPCRSNAPEVAGDAGTAWRGAFRRLSDPRIAVAIATGVLLYFLRGGREAKTAPPPPGISIPIDVEGIVAGPALPSRERCRVPLGDGTTLLIAAAVPGPLPGATLRARGRLAADGREILVPSPDFVRVLASPSPTHVGAQVERARRRLRERLARGTSPELARFLCTLLLGDRGIDPESRERFARTGTLHLLAVSGMHLILLLGLLRRTLGPGPRRLLVGIFVYAALTGFASPIGRAMLTAAFALLARAIGRRPRPAAHLLVTLSLVLAWDGRSVAEPGFILSFCAYAGILLGAVPLLERARRDPFRRAVSPDPARTLRARLAEALLVSAFAFGASVVPTLLLFQRLSPAAIPGSILLGPIINLLLAIGLFLVVVPGFAPAVALAEALVSAIDLVVRFLDRCPGGTFDVATPPLPAVVVAIASLCFLLARTMSGGPVAAALAGAVVAHALLLAAPGPRDEARLFPAGRGSALLAAPFGCPVLVDSGPASKRVDRRLLQAGITRLELLLLSHDHADHVGGVPRVLQALDPRERRSAFPREGFGDVEAGDRLRPGISVLWPRNSRYRMTTNDRSLVIRVAGRRGSLLAPGDLETRGLRALLREGALPRVETILLPHHGGRNDGLVDLLLRTNPEECWLSAWPGTAEPATLLGIAALGLSLRTTDRGPISISARD